MHLLFKPLVSADSAENFSIFFLSLYKSEIVDFPKPNSWATPAKNIPQSIILPNSKLPIQKCMGKLLFNWNRKGKVK